MRFRDIIGQEEVKRQLVLTAQQGRVPHARLFAGKQGVGKLQLAIAYAQYLNCTNPTDDDSCGQCPTCLQFEKLQHPDLHFAFPIVKTDSGDTCNDFMDAFRQIILDNGYFSLDDWYNQLGIENKQAVIYEKESSEILRKLSLKPFGPGYKVMIIWQAEKMNAACANKLLKLLEEPPEKTVFLLVSESPERLLPTILSRVQLVRVPPLAQEQIAQALTERGIDPESANDIAHLAQGSFHQALRVSGDNEQNRLFMEDFVALMRQAWMVGHRKDYESLQKLRQWSLKMADAKVGREKQKVFLQFVQRQIRENFIYNYKVPQLNYQMQEEKDFSRNFAAFIHAGNVEKIIAELDKAERQISQNGNAKIIFFDLCLQMIVLIKK
ncbi:MAG: DNA polymerase III subunit delta' [Paludibacteraceae bacterium]|nr:DNA polymerase III subunit delta' [Paludibacteraceae bacterium]